MLSDNKEKVQLLLERYYAGSISEGEVAELAVLLKDDQYNGLAVDTLTALAANVTPVRGEEAAAERMVERLKDVTATPPVWKRPLVRWSAAAAVAVLLGTGVYLQSRVQRPAAPMAVRYTSDLQPGQDKATLTLDDGSKIDLNGLGTGATVMQQGANMVKTGQGSIAYNRGDGKGEVQYNVLTTPLGGQFRLSLPDGSTVWLNAGSSIRFPTVFTGSTRMVELTGEAYFDVAQQASMPFVVKMKDGLKVEVLGTEFNASGYVDDNEVSATLVKGAVRVGNDADVRILKPGQQALAAVSGITLNGNADIAAITGWKNGLFVFNDTDIETVMKQLSRWYDMEVVYEGKVKEYFNGTISRSVPLSKVLELLESTGLVHFKIEGRKVTVTS